MTAIKEFGILSFTLVIAWLNACLPDYLIPASSSFNSSMLLTPLYGCLVEVNVLSASGKYQEVLVRNLRASTDRIAH